jgi:hypothetical protein
MPPATTSSRASPAAQAWRLIHQLIASQRGRFLGVAAEFELSPPQIMALQMLDPEHPLAMSELAAALGCDNSNVTGIVDRLACGLSSWRASTTRSRPRSPRCRRTSSARCATCCAARSTGPELPLPIRGKV